MKCASVLTRATAPLDFLFLNRSCFNGMIRFNKNFAFNVPYGHKPNRFSKAYVTKVTNQVAHVEKLFKYNDWSFICQSFEKTIHMAGQDAFIYCDPPYIGRLGRTVGDFSVQCAFGFRSKVLAFYMGS